HEVPNDDGKDLSPFAEDLPLHHRQWNAFDRSHQLRPAQKNRTRAGGEVGETMPEPSNKENYVVGVDLGGTKILAGVFDGSLECVGTAKVSTKSSRGIDAVVERLDRCVRDAVDEDELTLKQDEGVGVGAPTAVVLEGSSVWVV